MGVFIIKLNFVEGKDCFVGANSMLGDVRFGRALFMMNALFQKELVQVNYIKEINAFYVKLKTELLSMSAVSLWHGRMYVNNRVWTELKEGGLIVHRARGSRAPREKNLPDWFKSRHSNVG